MQYLKETAEKIVQETEAPKDQVDPKKLLDCIQSSPSHTNSYAMNPDDEMIEKRLKRLKNNRSILPTSQLSKVDQQLLMAPEVPTFSPYDKSTEANIESKTNILSFK